MHVPVMQLSVAQSQSLPLLISNRKSQCAEQICRPLSSHNEAGGLMHTLNSLHEHRQSAILELLISTGGPITSFDQMQSDHQIVHTECHKFTTIIEFGECH